MRADGCGTKGNILCLKFSGFDRVTVMPVVFADGRAWRPVVVVPGQRIRVRGTADGKSKGVCAVLPHGLYVYMRKDTTGVDTENCAD